jgi:hypothetical protein
MNRNIYTRIFLGIISGSNRKSVGSLANPVLPLEEYFIAALCVENGIT